jgi:hypothetical protein
MQTIRSHFFDVAEEEPVEEDLVSILQSAQIDMPLKVIVLPLVGLIRPDALLIEALDVRRQKPMQAELASFVLGERRAFVQHWAVQEVHPARDIWPPRLRYRRLLRRRRSALLPSSSDAIVTAT